MSGSRSAGVLVPGSAGVEVPGSAARVGAGSVGVEGAGSVGVVRIRFYSSGTISAVHWVNSYDGLGWRRRKNKTQSIMAKVTAGVMKNKSFNSVTS